MTLVLQLTAMKYNFLNVLYGCLRHALNSFSAGLTVALTTLPNAFMHGHLETKTLLAKLREDDATDIRRNSLPVIWR